MAIAGDTFVEGSDTALASHTPTGANAGSGWTQASGAIQVLGASDLAEDNNTGDGNRAGMNNNLGSDQMDVSLDVSFVNAVVADGLFCGPASRLSSPSSTAALYEFIFDWAVGVNGSYTLGTDTLDEAWPGGTVTMLLQTRTSDHRGFAGAVEKVSVTTDNGSGNFFSGMLAGNFTGTGTKRSRGDNFLAQSPPTISTQPTNQSVNVGSTTVFSISSSDAVSYQWQTQDPGSGTWNNVSGGSGATTNTYTTPALGFADDQRIYRCVATNTIGSTNSNGAVARIIGIASLAWITQ